MVYSFLKRAIPFALTFVVGATLGGFFQMFRPGETRRAVLTTSYRTFEYNYGHGCRHGRSLVAESKPLVILFKPDAQWPRGLDAGKEGLKPTRVFVTFGADGHVQNVEPVENWPVAARGLDEAAVWAAVERAARQIQFEPETINGIPVSVTKEVEIHFMGD